MGCGSSTPPKHALELYSKPPNAPVEVTTVCVIANPYSGGKRGGAVLKEVQRLLEDSSKVGEVAVFETRYGGHATEIAREHVWRFSAIVSIGGDGTLHEIVNGLMLGYLADTSRVIPPLCIVPCGSGNTVAYDFNIVDKNDSLDALFGGVARAIDVVEITDPDDPTRRVYRNMADDAAEGGGGGGGGAAEEKGDDGAAAAEAKTEDDDGGAFKDPIFSLNIVGFGLPVTVMDTANDLRWMGGAMYNCAAYLSLIKNRSYQCTVEFPNGEPEGWNPQTINPTVMFQAQNSCHMGEKMPYCPRAKVDDGLMDIVSTRHGGRGTLIKVMEDAKVGKHVENSGDDVCYVQTDEFVLRPDGSLAGDNSINVDGEVIGFSPYRARCIPRAVRVFVPVE